MRLRRSTLELGEPARREHPRACALEARGLGVEGVTKRVRRHRLVDDRRDVTALDERHALGVPMTRGRRVDDRSPAERRLTAEDDPVAAGGGHRRREAQLRPALPTRDDTRRDVGGSEMHVDTRTVGDRLELVERDVEAIRRRIRARCDESVSPAHLAPLDTREGWPRRAVRRRPARHPGRAPGRSRTRTVRPLGSSRSSSPSPIVPDQSVPVTTVPIPRSVNARSIQRRVGRSARARSTRSAARASAARSSSRPAPVFALTATTSAPGTSSPRLLERELEGLGVDGVGLRHGDDAVLDAEQPQDREVLVRLRASALAGVDHEEEEVDTRRARDHRAHEALVARARRRPRAGARRGARAARSRGRSRSRAAAPRAAGRCPSPSARARATSCRGRCGPRCRPSAACQRRLTSSRHGLCSQRPWSSSSGTKPRAS